MFIKIFMISAEPSVKLILIMQNKNQPLFIQIILFIIQFILRQYATVIGDFPNKNGRNGDRGMIKRDYGDNKLT